MIRPRRVGISRQENSNLVYNWDLIISFRHHEYVKHWLVVPADPPLELLGIQFGRALQGHGPSESTHLVFLVILSLRCIPVVHCPHLTHSPTHTAISPANTADRTRSGITRVTASPHHGSPITDHCAHSSSPLPVAAVAGASLLRSVALPHVWC